MSDVSIQNKTTRSKLPARPEPHWRLIESGFHIGYRKMDSGAETWVASSLRCAWVVSLVLDSAAPVQTTLNSGKHADPIGDHSAVVYGCRRKASRWSGFSTRLRVRNLLLRVVMASRSLSSLGCDDPIRQSSTRY